MGLMSFTLKTLGGLGMWSWIISAICLLGVLYKLVSNKHLFKQLTRKQLIQLIFLYAGGVLVLFVVIYYGANWLVSSFTNDYVRMIVFVVLVIGAFSIMDAPFKKLRDRATGGLVPYKKEEER